MYIIQAMAKSEFWGDIYSSLFDDMIGYAVLCVACVLFVSYLREKPPEFEKKRIAVSFVVLFVGAAAARILAHYTNMVLNDPDQFKTIFISAANHTPKEELLIASGDGVNVDDMVASALITLFSGKSFEGLAYQQYILIVNVLSTLISMSSISAGAFILMRIFRAKHIAPMVIVQGIGFLFRQIFRSPYSRLIARIVYSDPKKDVNLCGYNGFAYGCFMILLIIGYILVTKQKYESFWTKNIGIGMHLLLLGLVIVYTLLIYTYNYLYPNIDHKLIRYSFVFIIYTFLTAGLLYVPKRTYDLTRGELQEEFFEVKRKEEVEQYSYSETQIKAQRKYMHDLPGHFRAIASMAEKIGADEISQYVQELDEKLIESKGEFSTGNAFLDDFLYSKKKMAQQNNIDIVFNGAFPNEGVKRIDITTIFHNLIENAIEACKSVPGKREITISSKIHEDRVYISITNPFEQRTKKTHGKAETSKKNKGFHGYGLSSVESAARKKEYDGTFSKRQEDNIFIAEVNLKFKQ